MPKLHGNKGEWSEIYVFLYLLAAGRLYAANADLERIDSVYYGIFKIFRSEEFGNLEFIVNAERGKILVCRTEPCCRIAEISMAEFERWAKFLFAKLLEVSQASFEIKEVEEFLKKFHVETLKAKSSDKADIRMKIHDINTGFDAIQGFSIKSRLGAASTLVNASQSTNFIYEVVGGLSENTIARFKDEKNFSDKFRILREADCSLRYHKMANDIFECNLLLIDSYLPEICAQLLLEYYREGKTTVLEALREVEKKNPLSYNLSKGHPYYQYKFKKFLSESALGMLPSKTWNGVAKATGGYIIVKEDGDVLCYHLFNYNEFEQYLLNNTKFETPSTSRHGFGSIYSESGHHFLKLNLQIRFIK